MEINKNLINSLISSSLDTSKKSALQNKVAKSLLLNHVAEQPATLSSNLSEVLEGILKDSGFNVNSETIKMMQKLMDNNLPLNDDTLQKLNQALKIFNMSENISNGTHLGENTGDAIHLKGEGLETDTTTPYGSDKATTNKNLSFSNHSIEKAIFLLNNEMPITTSKANILETLVNGNGNFMHLLTKLAQDVINIDNSTLKNELIDILLKNDLQHIKNSANQLLNVDANNQTTLSNISKGDILQTLANTNLDLSLLSETNLNQIKEDLASNNLTIETLNEMLKPLAPLTTSDILEIATLLFENDPSLKSSFIKQLSLNAGASTHTPQTANALVKALLSQFSINTMSDNPKDIDDMLNQLKQNLTQAETLLLGLPYTDVAESIYNAKETLDFLNLVKDSVYIPLPINLGQTIMQGELFVFKDSKLKKNFKKATSALVALNTANLGRVETYIQKSNNNINLQFRLENIDVESIIKANINTLNTLLSEYNYTIQSFSVIPISENFNIVSEEPLISKSPATTLKPEVDISFDTRA